VEVLAARYVFHHLWPRAVFCVAVGWLLFVLMEGMETARWLARGTAWQVTELYLLRAPEVVSELIGPGVALGVLAGVGLLNRRAEMAALAAAGRSLAQVAIPGVLALSVVAAGVRVVLAEVVMPRTVGPAVNLSGGVFGMHGSRYWTFYYRDEWFQAGPYFARAQPQAGDVYTGVMAVRLDQDFAMRDRVVAQRMTPADESSFQLEDATVTTLQPPLAFRRADREVVRLPSAAAALAAPVGYPEQYGFSALRRVIARREQGGRDVSAYRVALARRFVDPVMVVLMGVIALALAARQRREASVERLLFLGGVAVALAQGVVMMADSLASRELLSTWVGALGAPLVAGVVAWLLWRGADGAKVMR
jgi:lipopolysaccharide export LptBFGC system permease protein LptF